MLMNMILNKTIAQMLINVYKAEPRPVIGLVHATTTHFNKKAAWRHGRLGSGPEKGIIASLLARSSALSFPEYPWTHIRVIHLFWHNAAMKRSHFSRQVVNKANKLKEPIDCHCLY